jgi:hypothetical protein
MKKNVLTAGIIVFVLTAVMIVSAGCGSSNPAPTSTDAQCTTLGVTTGATTNKWAPGFFSAVTITATSTFTMNSFGVKMTGAASNYFAAAIYTDAAGVPGYLMGATGITPDTGGWISVPASPVKIVPGTTYWLVVIGSVNGPCNNNTDNHADTQYVSYAWASFLSTGFPNDLSGESWAGNATHALINVSSCE